MSNEVAELLRQIVGKTENKDNIFIGKVKAVDIDKRTCVVADLSKIENEAVKHG